MICSLNTSIILIALILFPANAETNAHTNDKFEDVIAYVKSLELKLNNVENKLSLVEHQLEAQIEINKKQEKELHEQRTQINSLTSRNSQLEKKVQLIEKYQESLDRGLQRTIDTEATNTNTSRLLRRNVKQHTSDHIDMFPRFVAPEGENIAFSAFLNRDLTNLGPGHTIQYQATTINDGNAFNAKTGIFTVPVDGAYLFFFACEDYHSHRIYADIVVDGNRKSLILEGGDSHSMGSNLVIIRLTKGQTVWVAIDLGDNNDSLQNSATTFSGVFLHY